MNRRGFMGAAAAVLGALTLGMRPKAKLQKTSGKLLLAFPYITKPVQGECFIDGSNARGAIRAWESIQGYATPRQVNDRMMATGVLDCVEQPGTPYSETPEDTQSLARMRAYLNDPANFQPASLDDWAQDVNRSAAAQLHHSYYKGTAFKGYTRLGT